MNYRIADKIVEFVEEKRETLSEHTLTDLTGMSASHSRDEFKKVVGISVDKYRIRRQLTIIIESARKKHLKVSECNIAPWESIKGFSKAFKNEFGVSPSKFLRSFNGEILQSKVDISEFEEKHDTLKKRIESLSRKYGGKEKALLKQLSFEPYSFTVVEKMMLDTFDFCLDRLVNSKYAESQGKNLNVGVIPKEFYKEHENILLSNYSNLNGINIDQTGPVFMKSNPELQKILSYDYIISNRDIINELCKEVNLHEMIYRELSPQNLRTPWFNVIKNKNTDEGILFPDQLNRGDIPQKPFWYLHWTLINEQEAYLWNTWDEFRERIMNDYNQPIDNQEILCSTCTYKKECSEEDDCQLFDEMSEEEKDIEITKSDYVELTIDKLIHDVVDLLKEGLLYIDMKED